MDKLLSERDQVVLDTIFDPLQPLGVNANPAGITNEAIDAEDDPELAEPVAEALRRAIQLSESGELEAALELFGWARERAPQSASVLNDRAQALRLAGRNEEALVDLNVALEGRTEAGRTKAVVRALCQRGALLRCLGRDEEARDDFAEAAEAGSGFARSQLVAMNPYAAMCSAMLRSIAGSDG